MPELEVKYGRIREESRLTPQGTEQINIFVPIWIGDHGPFNERFSKEEYRDGFSLRSRVEALKDTLRALPT